MEQVEGVEDIADRFTVDEKIDRDAQGGVGDGLWEHDDEPAAIDAVDILAELADEHALAVVLFLEDVAGVAEQPG